MTFDPATASPVYKNAAKAHTAGVEFELVARPLQGLEVMGSFGFLFSEFREHEVTAYEGNTLPFAPQYQAGLVLQYTTPWGIFIRGEGNWNGKTYYDAANTSDLTQDGYLLLNANIGYKTEHLNVSFFIKNALDKEYYNMLVNWMGGLVAGSMGPPRTFGAEATLIF